MTIATIRMAVKRTYPMMLAADFGYQPNDLGYTRSEAILTYSVHTFGGRGSPLL
jgi:hypothetical protein